MLMTCRELNQAYSQQNGIPVHSRFHRSFDLTMLVRSCVLRRAFPATLRGRTPDGDSGVGAMSYLKDAEASVRWDY